MWRPWLAILAIAASLVVGISVIELTQPTEPQRNAKHHQAGDAPSNHKDHKSGEPETLWQKITSEPVAFTTLCLTGVTAILAVSTIGLWIVTASSSKRQSRDMQASIKIAERALLEVERAFVVYNRAYAIPSLNSDREILRYTIHIEFMNRGRTVARRFNATLTYMSFMHTIPEDFTYSDLDEPSQDFGALGPGVPCALTVTIPFSEIKGIECGRRPIIYGWAEYDDTFRETPRRRTEICVQISLLSDPIMQQERGGVAPLGFGLYGKYNNTDEDCLYRAGQTPRIKKGAHGALLLKRL